jgi:ClpP class serine protease
MAMWVGVARAYEAEGVDMRIFRSDVSPHKVEGNPYEPLTDEAAEHIQSVVDAVGAQFVADVAVGRGVPVATVTESFGQGRMLDAEAAVRAKMADRVATLSETLARYTTQQQESRNTSRTRAARLSLRRAALAS